MKTGFACQELCDISCPVPIFLTYEPSQGEARYRVQHGDNPEHSRVLSGGTPFYPAFISWLHEIHGQGAATP